MNAEEKLIEMFMKYTSGTYTKFDEIEDIATSIVELSVRNQKEKEQLKLMIKMARKTVEKSCENND